MPGIISDLESVGSDIVKLPGDIEHNLSLIEQVEGYLRGNIVGGAVSGLDTAGEAAVSGGVESFLVIGRIISVVPLIAVAVSIAYVFNKVYAVLDRLPGPLRNASKAFLLAALPVQSIVEFVIRHVAPDIASALHHWNTVSTVAKAVSPQVIGPPLPTAAEFAHIQTIKEVDGALAQLQYEIDTLKYQLSHIHVPSSVTNTNTTVVDKPTTVVNNINPQVWPEIHALQQSVSHLQSATVTAYSMIHEQGSTIAQIQSDFRTLEHEIGTVRTVTTGWADVVEQVKHLETTLQNRVNDLDHAQQHDNQQLRQLAPLGLLLQPGLKGLRTLRSLEDKPCQCPQFGNVPNELGTALALIEWIENG